MLTTSSLTSLEQIAGSLGVRVRTAPTPGSLWGIYDHRHSLITMKPDLASAQYRSTLAHELGHAHFGHVGYSAKAERQADKWAAQQLLTIEQLAQAAGESSTELPALAAELDVLPWVIRAFVSTLSERETQHLLALVRDSV